MKNNPVVIITNKKGNEHKKPFKEVLLKVLQIHYDLEINK